MLFLLALVLALIFLPWPWNFAVIVIVAACESAVAFFGIRYSRRHRARVGVEMMIGETGVVVTPLAPDGQVKIDGEIWQAHSDSATPIGATVRVKAIDGLTLDVERATAT
jgi:membrane protein implicated in regulation of membrane protease activity